MSNPYTDTVRWSQVIDERDPTAASSTDPDPETGEGVTLIQTIGGEVTGVLRPPGTWTPGNWNPDFNPFARERYMSDGGNLSS